MRIFLTFRGKFYMTQMFFPSLKVPSKAEITDAVQKVYPDARVTQYTMTTPDPTQPLIRVAEDVQRQQQNLQRKQLVIDKQEASNSSETIEIQTIRHGISDCDKRVCCMAT